MKAWDVVHEITSSISSLKKPELIISTKVRKEMVTVCHHLDMNDAEFSYLTEHLGHSKDVHKNWYRQEASTVELTHIAQLLLVKDQAGSFKDKKMKDLTGWK